jgi:hypothetical protein
LIALERGWPRDTPAASRRSTTKVTRSASVSSRLSYLGPELVGHDHVDHHENITFTTYAVKGLLAG